MIMINYVKSELYRVARGKGIYLLIGSCMALMVAMNLVLWYFSTFDPDFPYANARFSFLTLTTNMLVPMFLTAVLSSIVFADEFKNRTFYNSVAFGLHPVKILLGKWIVTLFVGMIALLVVEGALVGSAYLLFDDCNAERLMDLWKANQGCIPIFIASVSGYLVFALLLKNEMQAVWAWIAAFYGVGFTVSILAMKIKFFQWLQGWLAYYLVAAFEYDEENNQFLMMWHTSSGMTRMMIAGVLGTLVFWVIGIIGIRSKK